MNSDNQPDDRVRIHIEGLEIQARIGVTDEERSSPQRLVFNITLRPKQTGRTLEDKIERTVDYAAVCAESTRFVQARSDRLIETLADALAARLLELFAIEQVEIELRKFVLPDVEYVAVSVTRESAQS
jgi:dihydroneopterin aldolase